jgi:hypothetical protein
VISWTIPKTNQDGSPLQDLQGFDVYKTRYEPEAACPGCNESGEVFRHIDLEYLRQAFREEDRVFFLDSNLEPNFSYLYRIVPFTSKGQTGASATINREFLIPPPAPTGLHAAIGDQAVNLTWSARAEETAENGFLGYNIYRNEKSEPFPLTPLNEDYWAATSYTDRALPDTDTLSYTVRSVWRRQGLVIESPDSEPVSATLPEND